jgi:hypothetical protein
MDSEEVEVRDGVEFPTDEEAGMVDAVESPTDKEAGMVEQNPPPQLEQQAPYCPYASVYIQFDAQNHLEIEDPLAVTYTDPQYIIQTKTHVCVIPHDYLFINMRRKEVIGEENS